MILLRAWWELDDSNEKEFKVSINEAWTCTVKEKNKNE